MRAEHDPELALPMSDLPPSIDQSGATHQIEYFGPFVDKLRGMPAMLAMEQKLVLEEK